MCAITDISSKQTHLEADAWHRLLSFRGRWIVKNCEATAKQITDINFQCRLFPCWYKGVSGGYFAASKTPTLLEQFTEACSWFGAIIRSLLIGKLVLRRKALVIIRYHYYINCQAVRRTHFIVPISDNAFHRVNCVMERRIVWTEVTKRRAVCYFIILLVAIIIMLFLINISIYLFRDHHKPLRRSWKCDFMQRRSFGHVISCMIVA